MGVSREQAAENRRAIVAAAEKLFRERGVDAVGLAELMKAAGFTQGGFYNHFKSKDALVAAVMDKALEEGGETIAGVIDHARQAGADAIEQHIRTYLSPEHRRDIEAGCPLSGFAGDARRLDDEARAAYAQGLAIYLERIAAVIEERGGSQPGRPAATQAAATHAAARGEGSRAEAIALLSQLVGTLVLSRAVVDVAPALADEILDEGRRHLLDATGAHRGQDGGQHGGQDGEQDGGQRGQRARARARQS
ncbi:TetR/AcrR family transcriptional regulator [Paraburkholderia silviterrae]|uniref:TetR/AcrR family transcriptional regulator n=1 Tax=Paraburkholderia silviterrae TaxID=2528715 RepID=A0A4R5M206_9BURK|nr:TetR/AcrR family transcriptional regulator [Paraburkholderia silviterrae]TDG19431.1 TetR/AcrR family transcriptional regulator [Paraburkholderia silviterrae]